jgi:chromosome partitioning protein
MAQTISLLNMKGGVGKTTLAVNLAWHLFHNEGKNVLLIDFDPQFNATQYVMDYDAFDKHRKAHGTIADLLIEQPELHVQTTKRPKKDATDALHNIEKAGSARFDLLPAELALSWVVKNPAQMEYRLEKLLAKMRDNYDYVLIDCAPTDSVLTTMALTSSDFVLVPVRPDRFSILGFANVMNTIEDFRSNCFDPHKVKTLGVVFTQVMGTSGVETNCMAQVERTAKGQKGYVFTSSLRFSNSFIRSVQDQTPIFRTAYAQAGPRTEISTIADEMKTRITQVVTP